MTFQEKLREFLLNKFPDAKSASGNKEVVMRCRFCGDSTKDKKAKHLYLSLGYDNAPPMFLCFKCKESGILTPQILMSLVDCSSDAEMLYSLRDNNSKIVKLSKNRVKGNKVYNIKNLFVRDDKLSEAKLHYINKRLGLSLTYKDIIENKIVLNLLDLLNSNNIKKYTRHEDNVKELDESFIGFLSMDNGFINMKNLRPGKVSKYIDHEYVNYSIFEAENNSRRYYTIPVRCNLLAKEPIHIHISEGAFDILSIFYNLRGTNRQQNIYTSIGGKAYLNVVSLYLTTIGIMNCVFHLYVDNDVPDYQIREIGNILKPLNIPLYMHRNIYPGEKDFGVKLEKIVEQIERI